MTYEPSGVRRGRSRSVSGNCSGEDRRASRPGIQDPRGARRPERRLPRRHFWKPATQPQSAGETLSGDRKIDTVPLKDVQPLTGYIRGGVTALAAKKAYPVYVDETITLFDSVSLSSGARGTQIILDPVDYVRVTDAKAGAIAKEKGY